MLCNSYNSKILYVEDVKQLLVTVNNTLILEIEIVHNLSFHPIISRPNSLRHMRLVMPTWAIWCNENTNKFRVQ